MHNINIRLERNRIAYVKFILEGYDGLCQLTTIDAHRGEAFIASPACQADDLASVIDALIKEGAIKEVY